LRQASCKSVTSILLGSISVWVLSFAIPVAMNRPVHKPFLLGWKGS
jgi:hypothetical protein